MLGKYGNVFTLTTRTQMPGSDMETWEGRETAEEEGRRPRAASVLAALIYGRRLSGGLFVSSCQVGWGEHAACLSLGASQTQSITHTHTDPPPAVNPSRHPEAACARVDVHDGTLWLLCGCVRKVPTLFAFSNPPWCFPHTHFKPGARVDSGSTITGLYLCLSPPPSMATLIFSHMTRFYVLGLGIVIEPRLYNRRKKTSRFFRR